MSAERDDDTDLVDTGSAGIRRWLAYLDRKNDGGRS